MKTSLTIFFLIVFSLCFQQSGLVFGQSDSINYLSVKDLDKLPKKEKKAIRKKLDKEYLKGRRWRISTSFINATINSSIGVEDSQGRAGVELSLENFFGFEKKLIVPKFDFQYSFNRRSSMYAEFYNIQRNSSKDIDEDFDWGDIEIPEEAGIVNTYLDTHIWSLGYMYSFINKPHVEVSFFANIFILGLYTGIDVEESNIHNRLRLTAPLPSFGYRFNYEILPKFRFGVTHSFFFLNIGDYGGNINNFKINFDYRATKWLSTGISYSTFKLNVKSDARDFRGVVEYAYEGPGLYLNFIF